jgi:hypothetical protein
MLSDSFIGAFTLPGALLAGGRVLDRYGSPIDRSVFGHSGDLVDYFLSTGFLRSVLSWNYCYGPGIHAEPIGADLPRSRPKQFEYDPETDAAIYSWAYSGVVNTLTGSSNIADDASEHNVHHVRLTGGDFVPSSCNLYHYFDDSGLHFPGTFTSVPGYLESFSSEPIPFHVQDMYISQYNGSGDPELVGSFSYPTYQSTFFSLDWMEEIYNRLKESVLYTEIPFSTVKAITLDGRQFLRGLKVSKVSNFEYQLEYESYTYVSPSAWASVGGLYLGWMRRGYYNVTIRIQPFDGGFNLFSSYRISGRYYLSAGYPGNPGSESGIGDWRLYPEEDDENVLDHTESGVSFFPLTTRFSGGTLAARLDNLFKSLTTDHSYARYFDNLATARPSVHRALQDACSQARAISGNLVETSLKLNALTGLFGKEEAENLAKFVTRSQLGSTVEGYTLPVTVVRSLDSLGGISGVFGTFVKFIGTLHLLYRFGWKPLSATLDSAISSGALATTVQSGVIALGEQLNGVTHRGKFKLSKKDFDPLPCDELEVHSKFQLMPLYGLLATIAGLDRLQILPTPDRAFASLPFSWAVDWGIDASNRVSVISDFVLMTLFGAHSFVHSYKLIYNLNHSFLAPFGLEPLEAANPPQFSFYIREKSRYVPAVGFKTGAVIPFVPHHPDVGLLVSLAAVFLL